MKKINKDIILSSKDTLNMLDDMLEKWDKDWWESFYENKEKEIPFFVELADENLVSSITADELRGKSLDIGCGNGRNSIYMSKKGFDSLGIDLALEAIMWAKKKAKEENSNAQFSQISIFDYEDKANSYSRIHDSGCLHHIKPHRRPEYLNKIYNLLSEEGRFTLVCFNLDGGTNISDYEVYQEKSMQGGLGYTKEKLCKILEPYFNIDEIRTMKSNVANTFGTDLCWAVSMTKK